MQLRIINPKQRREEPARGAPRCSPHLFIGTGQPSVKAQPHPGVAERLAMGQVTSKSTRASIFPSALGPTVGAAILYLWPPIPSTKTPVNCAAAIFHEKLALQLLHSHHRVSQKGKSLSAFLTTAKEAAILYVKLLHFRAGLLT